MKKKINQKQLSKMVNYAVKNRANFDFCAEAVEELERVYKTFELLEKKTVRVKKNKPLLMEYLEYCIDHFGDRPEFQMAVETLSNNGKTFKQDFKGKEKFAALNS